MNRNRMSVCCASLMLAAMLAGCGKADNGAAAQADARPETSAASNSRIDTASKEKALPKECIEAEDAQRACTESMAAGFEKLGQAAAAKSLRDALPAEMEQARTRWMQVDDKDGLAKSCAAARDAIRAQPSCHRG